MRRKSYAFVRSHRRKWGLTQVELARLVGLSSRSAVSGKPAAAIMKATSGSAIGVSNGLTMQFYSPIEVLIRE